MDEGSFRNSGFVFYYIEWEDMVSFCRKMKKYRKSVIWEVFETLDS